MNNKIKNSKQFLDLLDDTLNKKDFISAFKKLLKIVLEVEKKLTKRIETSIDTANEEQTALKNSTGLDLSNLQTKLKAEIDKALKEQGDGMNFVYDKAKRIKNFKNGKDGVDGKAGIDADEKKIINKVLKKIKLPEQEKEILEIQSIGGLKEELDELKEELKASRKGGGGFSKIAAEIHIIDNELIGTGDGSTTVFTLNHSPNPIASLRITVGGGELFETDDWTISGQSITFLTAPPNGAKIRGSYRI